MRRIAWLAACGSLFTIAPIVRASSPVPPLVPVDDPLVTTPLLPAGINQNPPECFGQYAHVWEHADGTQIIQYYGDFSLRLGQRQLRSREAVIWMSKSLWQNTTYYHFEVFLNKDAEVRETAGSTSTGPALFVTFNSIQPPVVEADIHTGKVGTDSQLYQEAAKTRQKILIEGNPATQPSTAAVAGHPTRKTRPQVHYSGKELHGSEEEGIVTATGDVYVSQGTEDVTEFLEIRADAAVLFLSQKAKSTPARIPTTASSREPFPTEASPKHKGTNTPSFGADLDAQVTGVYLRGNVILTRGERMVRASELYYDFENDRALMLDAVMRTLMPQRELPIYVRAQEVRQLSSSEFYATKANISASEFHTPHVSLGADRLYLTDSTPRDQTGRVAGIEGGHYRAYDATLNVDGIPLAYSPYSEGDVQQQENLLHSIRFGYSSDFGATFESKWYLFNLLGVEKPQGVDALMRLDYFSKRGPGIGFDIDYEKDKYYGQFRGYYIHDTGDDKGLGPFKNGPPDTDDRGRFTIRHRELLPNGIEFTLEASYISDPNFLQEYFKHEFETGKEQETLIYLKKQQDNWAVTALTQWRVLDFLTQTEHLPDLGFNWIGQPIEEIASFYNESHVGFERYQPDNRQVYNGEYRSRMVFRADTRNEIDVPIKLGDVNLVPFAMARPSYYDDSPVKGSLDRMFGMAGARLGTQAWRTYPNVESRIFDVNGIRHIIRPEATAWASASNQDSRDLYPFDQYIEDVNDFYGTSLALRNLWETKRGGPGQWRTVDWMKFDVELNLFGNQPHQPLFWSWYNKLPIGRYDDNRPEDSIARDHVKADYMYRISDTTAIMSDANFDLNNGNLDLFNISYEVERTPRFSYTLGYRWIGPTQSNLVGGGFNYQINEKHTLALRSYYDLDRGELGELEVAIVRKFPRFNAALIFGLDKIAEDEVHVGVSIWPEGAPRAAIGNHHFTSLSESTGIRRED